MDDPRALLLERSAEAGSRGSPLGPRPLQGCQVSLSAPRLLRSRRTRPARDCRGHSRPEPLPADLRAPSLKSQRLENAVVLGVLTRALTKPPGQSVDQLATLPVTSALSSHLCNSYASTPLSAGSSHPPDRSASDLCCPIHSSFILSTAAKELFQTHIRSSFSPACNLTWQLIDHCPLYWLLSSSSFPSPLHSPGIYIPIIAD